VLAQRWERRLVTVVAGPGFGKTVLLVAAMARAAVEGTGRDVWLSCEPADESEDHLRVDLCEAVGVPGPRIEAFFDWVWTQAPNPVCVVLDDVHEVPAGSTGAALLEQLVAELPRNGHLLLASRDVVPVATARLATGGQLVRVTEGDLMFDHAELEDFAGARGVDTKLLASSGGWPALAELAASAGADLVPDYLWEEVLAGIGPERARDLARFALAGGGDDEIASAVTGQSMRVEDLLSTVPLVSRTDTGWAVLHPLWRPVLQPLLSDADANAAAARAADVHRRHQRFSMAFDLLAEAEAWDDALGVMGEAATGLALDVGVASGEFGRWCRALPASRRQAPEAQLAAGLELQTRAPRESMTAFEAAAAGYRARDDIEGELVAIAADGLVRWWANDLAGLLGLHERTQVLAATGSPSARVLAAVGLAAMAHLGGDSAGVLSALADIGDDLVVRWLPTVHWFRSVAHRRLGDLPRAYAELDTLARVSGGRSDLQADIARLRSDWLDGRVDHVPGGLQEIREHYLRSGDRFFEMELTLELANRQAWLGDREAAATLLDAVDPTLRDWSVAQVRHMRLATQAAIALGLDDEPGAAALLRDGGVGELTVAEQVFWRDRAVAVLAHVLVPEARSSWTQEPLGPAYLPAAELAEALEASRRGDISVVRALRWPEAGVVRAHLPLPWVVELACAGVAARNPPPHNLLDALGPRLRPALLALTTRATTDVAAAAKRMAAQQPAVPAYRLRIGVIGPLEMHRDADVVAPRDLRRERVRELLCYLVARRRVRREAAAEELWPELDDPGHNLRVNLSHLQKVLQPERPRDEPPYFLRAEGPWLDLRDDLLDVDAWQLDSHLDDADRAERANEPMAALTAYRAAMDLWRGMPYADVPYAGWADIERTRIRTRLTKAATRAGELLLASGATADAQAAAHRAIDAESSWEPAYRLLIRARIAEGDVAGARRALDDCRTALAELGVEPAPETIALAK
jgi:DNA-binding SARP family transcriptional activator